jgi:N-acetylglucosaminyldiphosphoundecaprenol N-acetyl-beta-D-mannosaminyltransferase
MQKRGPVRILSEDIVGYPVSPSGRDMLVAQVMAWIAGGEGGPCHYFACANPHAIEMAEHDPDFRRALVEADFLTPDGIGVVYASRLLGGAIRERVTGMDIFLGTMTAMQAAGGGRCFFLGSTGRRWRPSRRAPPWISRHSTSWGPIRRRSGPSSRRPTTRP